MSFEIIIIIGLRIKELKEIYEGEVTEITPVESENPMGGMTVMYLILTIIISNKIRHALLLIVIKHTLFYY